MNFFTWLKNLFSPKQQAPLPITMHPTSPPAPAPTLTTAPKPVIIGAWDGSIVLGADLAHYQDKMGLDEWRILFARGFRWFYPKATDGDNGPDTMLGTHKRLGKSIGMISSAGYCFSRYSTNPVTQAEKLVAITGGVKVGELPHVLDVEWDNSVSGKARYGDGKEMDEAAEEHTYLCLSRIEALTGVTPWIYTSAGFFVAKNAARFARFPALIANYSPTTADNAIKVPRGLHAVARQYSGKLTVGRVSEIDGDRFLGTLDQLNSYVRK